MLTGDFNLPGINWSTQEVDDCCGNKQECKRFLDVMEAFHLRQVVKEPTRINSDIGLVLTTHPEAIDVKVLEYISDNKMVHCVFLLLFRDGKF